MGALAAVEHRYVSERDRIQVPLIIVVGDDDLLRRDVDFDRPSYM